MRHVRDSKGSRDLMTCLAHSISFDGSVLYSVSCGCTSNPHSTMYRSFRYWVSKRKFPPTARKKKQHCSRDPAPPRSRSILPAILRLSEGPADGRSAIEESRGSVRRKTHKKAEPKSQIEKKKQNQRPTRALPERRCLLQTKTKV